MTGNEHSFTPKMRGENVNTPILHFRPERDDLTAVPKILALMREDDDVMVGFRLDDPSVVV